MAYGGTTTHIDFVYVRPGVSRMGWPDREPCLFGPDNSNERPVHEIDLSGFFIGKLEVTVGSEIEVLQPPAGKDVDEQLLVDVRRMLTEAGITSG